MAESQQKRRIEDEIEETNSNLKRLKQDNAVPDDDEKEALDVSDMFTDLEQVLSSSANAFSFPPEDDNITTGDSSAEDDGVKSVIRHLIEASDDELGIPNTNYNREIESDEDFPFGSVNVGLWELEDVAANYYIVLQSELFM